MNGLLTGKGSDRNPSRYLPRHGCLLVIRQVIWDCASRLCRLAFLLGSLFRRGQVYAIDKTLCVFGAFGFGDLIQDIYNLFGHGCHLHENMNSQQAGCKQTFRLPFLRHGVTISLLEAARQRAITMVKEVGPSESDRRFHYQEDRSGPYADSPCLRLTSVCNQTGVTPGHMARLKTCGKPSVSDRGRFFVFRKVVCRNQPGKTLGWFLFTRLV